MYFFLGICQSMIGDRVIIDDSIPQIKFDRLLGICEIFNAQALSKVCLIQSNLAILFYGIKS